MYSFRPLQYICWERSTYLVFLAGNEARSACRRALLVSWPRTITRLEFAPLEIGNRTR